MSAEVKERAEDKGDQDENRISRHISLGVTMSSSIILLGVTMNFPKIFVRNEHELFENFV